jgi:kynurenine formamidase
MIFTVEINNCAYHFSGDEPIDISIPINFHGAQPNAYGVETATAQAYEAGDLVGDTRRGGSCNFEQVKFIPHCSGTHTESVGHITNERISIHSSLKDSFIPSTLVSIEPENAADSGETYAVNFDCGDKLITRKLLEKVLENVDKNFLQGLIIRTLPNDDEKKSRVYLNEIPPYFSTEAMNYLAELKVNHLLADLPSIDRIFDEGKLSNHHIFWKVNPGEFEINAASFINNTITELIFVPENVKDGGYLLNLQIAPFVADAAPSRPLLFKLN